MRFLCLVVFVAGTAFGKPLSSTPPPADSLYYGVLVHYQPATRGSELDKLHGQVKGQLKQRYAKWNVDWILDSKKQWLTASQAERLCSRYQKSRWVKTCQPNFPLRFYRPFSNHDGDEATNPPKSGSRDTAAQVKYCDSILAGEEAGLPPLEKGGLTALWAQYQIGSDLVPQLLEEVPDAKPIPVGVYDSGFHVENIKGDVASTLKAKMEKDPNSFSDPHPASGGLVEANTFTVSHGDQVANLINSKNSKYKVGVGYLSELTHLVPTLYQSDAANIPTTGVKLANVSLGWHDEQKNSSKKGRLSKTGEFAKAVFNEIKKNGTIVVFAAGNDYPKPVDEVSKLGILVGSSAPNGLASGFSQEDSELVVLAPSHNLITGLGAKDNPLAFGGTSGAAPLVTGALAAPLSLLPGLTQKEAKDLLKLSSTPSFNSKQSQMNGAGILNQYRLVKAALRLRKHWPANRDKISDSATYDFSKEAKQAKQEALSLLTRSDCADQTRGFQLLRQSFFLNPADSEVAEKLNTIYKAMKRPMNAAFFENLSKTPQQLLAQVKRDIEKFREEQANGSSQVFPPSLYAATRNVSGKVGSDFFRELAGDKEFHFSEMAMKKLAQAGDLESLSPFLKSSDPLVRSRATTALAQFEPAPPLEVLKEMAKDSNPEVALDAARASRQLGYEGLPVFQNALKSLLEKPESHGRQDALDNLFLGSWFLADKQTDFLAEAMKTSPRELDPAVGRLFATPHLNYGTLLNRAGEIPDEKLRESILGSLERHFRENTEKLQPEQVSAAADASLDLYKKGTEKDRDAGVGLLSLLGERGSQSLRDLFISADGPARKQILLQMSSQNPLLTDFAKQAVKENLSDPETLVTAIRRGHDSMPNVIDLASHPSSQVKEALIDSLKFNQAIVTKPQFETLATTALHSNDAELSSSAAHALGIAANPKLNQFGKAQFQKMTPGQQRGFLFGVIRNADFRAQGLEVGLENPSTRTVAVEAILFEGDARSLIKEYVGDLERVGPQRKNFMDGFFASPMAQSRFDAGNKITEVVAAEWAERGFPEVSQEVRATFSLSRSPTVKKVLEDYKKKTGIAIESSF